MSLILIPSGVRGHGAEVRPHNHRALLRKRSGPRARVRVRVRVSRDCREGSGCMAKATAMSMPYMRPRYRTGEQIGFCTPASAPCCTCPCPLSCLHPPPTRSLALIPLAPSLPLHGDRSHPHGPIPMPPFPCPHLHAPPWGPLPSCLRARPHHAQASTLSLLCGKAPSLTTKVDTSRGVAGTFFQLELALVTCVVFLVAHVKCQPFMGDQEAT